MAFAFVSLWIAVGFAAMGRRWMTAAAFPAAFLYFFVPLPDSVVPNARDWVQAGLFGSCVVVISNYGHTESA
jgi:predicted membrane metal-binding protein